MCVCVCVYIYSMDQDGVRARDCVCEAADARELVCVREQTRAGVYERAGGSCCVARELNHILVRNYPTKQAVSLTGARPSYYCRHVNRAKGTGVLMSPIKILRKLA